jgi:hypothetical protein
MARAGIGPIIADRVAPKKTTTTPVRQSSAISADAAERRINTARNNAIAEVKKSPTSADAAERRIQNAVNKEIAVITGKAVPPIVKKPVVPTTIKKPTVLPTKPPATNGFVDPGDKSNSGNQDSSSGGGVAAIPQSLTSSDDVSSSSATTEVPPIKSAPIDAVIFADEAFAEEFLVDVLFEDLVGQELLSIARGDTVNGQEVIYQPIKNLGLLQGIYNPNNILGLADTSASFFSSFVIQLNEKIPAVSSQSTGKNYYVDPTNGDIIIELVNIVDDEQVEVQIATSGTIDRLGI